MQKMRAFLTFLANLVLVILFSILGGIIAGVLGPLLLPQHEDMPWQLLENSNRVSHIIGTKGYDGILVQIEDGKYYSYFINSRFVDGVCDGNNEKNKCKVWMKVEQSSIWDWPNDKKIDCSFKSVNQSPFLQPPPPLAKDSVPIECAYNNNEQPHVSHSRVYYALLDNGELWMYQSEAAELEFPRYFFESILFGIITGGIFGIFVGHIRADHIRRNRRSEQEIG